MTGKRNKEYKKEYDKKYRRANCDKISDHKKKYNETHREQIREYNKIYNETHRETIINRHKEYYETHREHSGEYSRQYRESDKYNAGEHKEYCREYHINNRNSILERHRRYRSIHIEQMKKYSRQYREENPEKVRAMNERWHKDEANKYKLREYTRERRARKRNAPGRGITAEQEKEIYEQYNYHCAYCGNKFTESELTIDHIEPLIHGGADDIENATACCRICNASKGDKTLLRFLYDRHQRELI